MNPFEKLANERNEDEDKKVAPQKDNSAEAKDDYGADKNAEVTKDAVENPVEDNEKLDDESLALPPPINTYFLISFFSIAVLFIIVVAIVPVFLSLFSYVLFGLACGTVVKFLLDFIFRKTLAEPYVDKHLAPLFTQLYGDLLSRKELIKLVANTNKIVRKRYVDKDRLMTASALKKDGTVYLMLSGISKDKTVWLAFTADGEQIVTVSDAFLQKKIFKLLINGFHGFWDSNLGVPSEFTSVSEEGVFKGAIIFETEEQAIRFSETQEALSEDDIVSLVNRGEMFRFLEMASKVGLDTMVVMQDGTKFSASASSLFYEFQNSSSN